jgi:hypothetical protein
MSAPLTPASPSAFTARPREGGGIGRRTGFRYQRGNSRKGSSPFLRTELNGVWGPGPMLSGVWGPGPMLSGVWGPGPMLSGVWGPGPKRFFVEWRLGPRPSAEGRLGPRPQTSLLALPRFVDSRHPPRAGEREVERSTRVVRAPRTAADSTAPRARSGRRAAKHEAESAARTRAQRQGVNLRPLRAPGRVHTAASSSRRALVSRTPRPSVGAATFARIRRCRTA